MPSDLNTGIFNSKKITDKKVATYLGERVCVCVGIKCHKRATVISLIATKSQS